MTMHSTSDRAWKLREALALAIETLERDKSEALAEGLRRGDPFTFQNLATQLDVDLGVLIERFQTEVHLMTGVVLQPRADLQ